MWEVGEAEKKGPESRNMTKMNSHLSPRKREKERAQSNHVKEEDDVDRPQYPKSGV